MTQTNADVKTISRRGLVLGMATLPAAAAVACGGEAGGSPPAAKSLIPGKVTVVSYQTSAPRLDRQIANYEAFNKEYKPQGLEVEFVNPGSQSVIEKITVLHVAGTPADMWESAFLWRDQEGALTELTPLMKADKIDEKQWLPEAINMMKPPTPWPPPSNSKIWGMPVSISADALAINLQLFEAAGLKPPPQNPDDPSWTMDAFTELATKLTKGTTQFGWGGSYTPGNEWLNGATYFGYGPVDLAGKKITIDTAGYRAAHQYWFDMFNRRHLAPIGAELEALRSSPGQAAFLTGKVAMDRISNFPNKPDFRWAVCALPYTPNPAQPKSVAGRISVHGLYMDSDTKNKDRTWQVFRYWMRPDKNQDYVWSDGHVMSPLVKTGSEQSLKAFQDSVGPVDAKAFLLQAQRSRVDGWGLMLLKNWKKADTENIPVYADARAGKIPVSEFTTKAQESVTRLASF